MKEQYSDDSVFTVKSQKGYLAKKALLDAGIELIADLGVNGFSISDLCKKAGRKRTVFYTYFETLDQFFDELYLRERGSFYADFENQYGQSHDDMTPGLKRMVLSLRQFFSYAENHTVWNRFVVKLCAQHESTAAHMLADTQADVIQGIEVGDFGIEAKDADLFAHLVLASLSITSQQLNHNHPAESEGVRLIEMLLDAGKVQDKTLLIQWAEEVSK